MIRKDDYVTARIILLEKSYKVVNKTTQFIKLLINFHRIFSMPVFNGIQLGEKGDGQLMLFYCFFTLLIYIVISPYFRIAYIAIRYSSLL